MRQSQRNRPAGYFAGDSQRRVASSDTRKVATGQSYGQSSHQVNNNTIYEQVINQNRQGMKASSVSRPSKDLNRSIGFRQGIKQNSTLLHNAADLLNVGGQNDLEDEQAQPQRRPGPQTNTKKVSQLGKKHSQQPPQNRGGGKLSQAGEAYQSSLLTRYVKQPPLPSSNSIHSALNYERQTGWPSLAPVRQAAAVAGRGGAASSGIPRPTPNKMKSKTGGRVPSQQPGQRASTGKVKYAFQTPITYQNEQEIMKKIFGAQNMVKRTSSDSRFQPQFSQLNQTTYTDVDRRPSPQKPKKTPQQYSNKMPPKAVSTTNKPQQRQSQQRQQDPYRQSVTKPQLFAQSDQASPPKQHQQRQRMAAQAYSNNDDSFMSSPNPSRVGANQSSQNVKNTISLSEYSEPRSDARVMLKNLMHQQQNQSPTRNKDKETLASDSAERAFFELQDAKVNFFQEKEEHEDKKEQRRKTFTNGFYNASADSNMNGTAAPVVGGINNTTTNTFASSSQANGQLYQIQSRSNGFQISSMGRTQQNRFGDQPLIGDDKDLKSDIADISREDMKERLIVAEKVMKTLFKRNKELEEQHILQQESENQQQQTQEVAQLDITGAMVSSQNHIDGDDTSKLKIRLLEQQIEAMEKGQRDKAGEPQSYKDFMNMRLEQSQAESKRHFENYVNMRDQLNQQMEKQLQLETQKVNATPDSRHITPKTVKGSKLRVDLGTRAFEASLQEQDLVLKREAESYSMGLKQIEEKLLIRDARLGKAEAKVTQLEQEVERRKFLDSKVQTYVRSLIDQNEKCKTFIRNFEKQKDQAGNGMTNFQDKARSFLRALETNQFDEHDGQSTENEEEDEEEADVDDEDLEDAELVEDLEEEEEGGQEGIDEEQIASTSGVHDVAISDIV